MNTLFSQFCRRKWLDHCDENKTAHSKTYTEEEGKKEGKKGRREK